MRNLLGPYQLLFKLLLSGLVILTISRIGLIAWQWDRVEPAISLGQMLLQGVRADSIMMGMLLVPLALLMPFLANRIGWSAWQKVVLVWGVIAMLILVFMEASTPAFIMQYDLRPNRLFIEYLKYPKEVFSTLWHGFKLPLILGLSITALAGWAATKVILKWQQGYQLNWPWWKVWLTWPLLVILLLVMIRSSLGHRPANPASFAITSDALVNSLVLNSAWSVYFAIYNMQHEAQATDVYGDMADEDIMTMLRRDYPWLHNHADATFPTLNQRAPSVKREKPLNLVIILEESLGATFVESLGGDRPATPELEKLKQHGWWFDQLYATGTRSVRGIEATISGFLPTPARSVVKLSLSQQNFFTIADLLSQQGYFTEFMYGGEAHFDNMASFFMGNGFNAIIEQKHFENPTFKGSWGASDEDLFAKAHQRITEMNAKDQPYFGLVFSSSNHSPYEFPDDRIELIDPNKHTDINAVKYADCALGKFMNEAMQSDYWENTLFLVVADHDLNVHGDALVPIERFQIPGLIMGADIKPKEIKTVASQIDMAPTLLSLMGIEAETPMIGRDLSLADEQNSSGRALMQFADYFALMRGEDVTVLRPHQPALAGKYSTEQRHLNIEGLATEENAQDALAHVLLPSWLYRQQRYDTPVGRAEETVKTPALAQLAK
ncbi:LTA synthase family protein [Methylophaga sp. OBS3]|uniref:LTA synthase family protein n=1 Tax=Methylophaga sp. OBS3 TaxID=2991934 RepID=UPI002250F622|nr:LTA synthase family protein [Methylophaga sp. OBS3]MCX4189624.1 LTA synthase family protein [Methylophaga sp. OBS3]